MLAVLSKQVATTVTDIMHSAEAIKGKLMRTTACSSYIYTTVSECYMLSVAYYYFSVLSDCADS